MDKAKSRKLLLTMLAVALASAAFWTTAKISGIEYLTFLFLTTVGYGAQNLVDKWFEFMNLKKPEVKPDA